MEMATVFFQERLQAQDGAKARAYLRDRGLTGRTIQTFRLGYSPDSRNALKEYLAAKGVEKEQIEACGLVVHRSDIAVSYDRFRDRIMFPITDRRERVIAFGGRALSSDVPAKYLNSNDTELFHKGRVLYNLAQAGRAVREAGTVIAVEGYMDVIALHQAGIANVVAPLGTALTEEQLQLLWRVCSEPVLCFDGDEAGVRAAYRAADLALAGLRPGRSIRFTQLPEGRDPDDIVREQGRTAFDEVVRNARPLADMIWSRETATGVFDTPERRAELETRMRAIAGSIADESVRRHYQQDMQDRLNGFFEFRRDNREGRDRRSPSQFARNGQGTGPRAGRRFAVSSKLANSKLVRGASRLPALRESVLVLTLVNHPQLLTTEFDQVAAIELENAALKEVLTTLLNLCQTDETVERERVFEMLGQNGLAGTVGQIEQQVRNSRIWTATDAAATEDARAGFMQALSLHNRARSLKHQKSELERDIADATESGDGGTVPGLLQALRSVQSEVDRLERQEAIIDGFGILSGRVRGAVSE
jgi:DNA primase